MVFYFFGPDASSWAMGNEKFGLANNLPLALQHTWDQLAEPFTDKSMAGTLIDWLSSCPDGRFALMTRKGDLISNANDMLEVVKSQLSLNPGSRIDHVAFSPLGGWFIRYYDGTVQLSGKFPDSFYTLASSYLDITSTARQVSQLSYVVCGFQGAVILKAGSTIHWNGIPPSLAKAIEEFPSGGLYHTGLTLGKASVLCPWSTKYYFCAGMPMLLGGATYPYVLPSVPFGTELLNNLASNVSPASNLIPKITRLPQPSLTTTAPTPKPSTPSATKPTPPVLPPRNPSSSSNPFLQLGKENVDSSGISTDARKIYEGQFDAHSNGRLFITGNEAVTIMMGSGLDTKTLSEIWEQVDLDRNGKLDKEEFVRAMWHIDQRQGGSSSAVRATKGHLTCDGCSRGICIGEEVYFCNICNNGDFDLCTSCYEPPYLHGCSVSHNPKKMMVELLDEPEPRETPQDHRICDGCGTKILVGDLFYWCETCSFGDNDFCTACWKAQRTCGHSMVVRRLVAGAESNPHGMPPMNSNFNYNQNQNQPSTQEPDEIDKLSKKFNDAKLKDALMSSILSEKPNVKWEDVAGLESAKAELQEAIIFPIRFPQMFRGKRRARRALLLYGPPGTGKSYLAKAVATEVDHTLFSVSSSDIMSKWIGESEQLMKQLFELAREKKPSIIFIDEIDALCGNRDGGGTSNEDTSRMKTEFLVQMDGVGNNNDGVFVLGATNLPWSLDPAVRRRFQKRIHVPLPDESARRELFKVHSGDMAASLGDVDRVFWDLARRTEGYSGSDIANLVQDALMMPVKKVYSATYFRKYRDSQGEWYTPCQPGTPGAVMMKWSKVPGRQLKEPPLTVQDMYEAVEKTKKSVGEEEIRKCSEWTVQYGLEGA